MLCPGLAACCFAVAVRLTAVPWLRRSELFLAIPLLRESAPCHCLSLLCSSVAEQPVLRPSTAWHIQAIPSPVPAFLCLCLSVLFCAEPPHFTAQHLLALPCHCAALPRISFATPCQSVQSPCESSQCSAVALGHLYRQGSSRPFCPGYTVCRMQTAPSSLISRYR